MSLIRLQNHFYDIHNILLRSSKHKKNMMESAARMYQAVLDKNNTNFTAFNNAVSNIPVEKLVKQDQQQNETFTVRESLQYQAQNKPQNSNHQMENDILINRIDVQANQQVNHTIEANGPKNEENISKNDEDQYKFQRLSEKQQLDHQQKLQNNNIEILSKVQSDRQLQVINLSKNTKNSEEMTISRIKQIEQEKRMIQQELKKLDSQIQYLRNGNQGQSSQNDFKKRQKISRDVQAQKRAVSLVKQLHKQRKELQLKKKKQQEKLLKKYQIEEEVARKARQQQAERAKQERRLAIQKRMNEEKKRRQQRKMIDAQSNQLIVQLRKQEQLQKQKNVAPSQLFQVEHRKRVLQNKKKLDFAEIEQHQRRYQIMKAKQREQKKQRQLSLKHKSQEHQIRHYGKNRWMQQLEQDERRRKQEQFKKQQLKKNQLQKRLKYGELVKNIFIPKAKPPKDQSRVPEMQDTTTQVKPHTPDQLPKVNDKTQISHKRRTYDHKIYSKQQALPSIKDKRSASKNKNIKIQEDPDEKMRKIRQLELRKQTNQRLKKLQNQSVDMLKKTQQTKSHKYENYLGHFKPKRRGNQEQELKKILANEKLTSEEKYRQLMNKASLMEKKAKVKEDFNKDGDQQAVNLYIGSIQAKLALLQKF